MDVQAYLLPFILTVLAGLSTTIGGVIVVAFNGLKPSRLIFSLGISAGAMLYVSLVELLGIAVKEINFFTANLVFLAGMLFMMAVDFMVPHKYFNEIDGVRKKDLPMYRAATLIAIGIAIHNFPEGLAVLLSGFVDIKLGIALAIAIAAHNIPEGIAVATPTYFATKSKKKAVWYAFFSGLAEPLGALIGIIILGPYISMKLIGYLYAFIAGIMVLISFDELLPQMYSGKAHHHAIVGVLVGFLLIMLSLLALY